MNDIMMTPIGWVRGGRVEAIDDDWGAVESEVVLDSARFTADALTGLDAFSHAVIVFVFDKVDPAAVITGASRPRDNPAWPSIGIFAQRGRLRPNRLGVTTVEVVAVNGLRLSVRGLDAIDGTPVMDIKPVVAGFEPRGALRQPEWADEIMRRYW